MSAENDDFIRRRICDRSLSQSSAGEDHIRRRSLAQLWASVLSDEPNSTPKQDADKPDAKKSADEISPEDSKQ